MRLLFTYLLILSSLFIGSNSLLAQENITLAEHISFQADSNQRFGFDSFHNKANKEDYNTLRLQDSSIFFIPFKSVEINETDKVQINLHSSLNISYLELRIDSTEQHVIYLIENDSTASLPIPPSDKDYKINAYYKDKLVGAINVKVYEPIIEDLYIVSLTPNLPSIDSITEYLNKVYSQASLKFHIIDGVKCPLNKLIDKEVLSNPSSAHDRYTKDMRDIRDEFFKSNPNLPSNAYYVFIIPEFVNESVQGYMVRNKAMAFVKDNENLFHSIAKQLTFGIGMLDASEQNHLFDDDWNQNLLYSSKGNQLTHKQWTALRHSTHSFSFFDGDEDVTTNNGLVAYFLWEEDENGNIKINQNILNSIRRPYKKNYTSYHLNIRDVLFQIVFEYKGIYFCWWHIITWSLAIIGLLYIRLRRRKRKKLQLPRSLKRTALRWILRGLVVLFGIGSYHFINYRLSKYEVKSGLIESFNKQDIKEVSKNVLHNVTLKHKDQDELMNEILIKRGDNWYMKHRKKVLYFNVFMDSSNNVINCQFGTSKDSLIVSTKDYRELAISHYMVFNHYNESDSLIDQKAFNHKGIEVSSKIEIDDPAKRILLFVNGYRPTSVEHSFEENFNDVLNNGLEFENSSNQIYSFDRYDYWRPWNEIDLKFIDRINPSEVFYADGHFSVATSNHESLINFTKTSSTYPHRCKDKNKHVCMYVGPNSKTIDMLPTKPNKTGFKIRRNNGQIAAKNLDMMINEIPNVSDNDTLYIVAHSMGYAYSLGIIDKLRGKINFGGFYIIAPENASSGAVETNEWDEVWQYGSKMENNQSEAPCLLDGIAPQTCAKGLTDANRCYIPNQFYTRKGFFDSHFVGYYSWVFRIKEGYNGHIKQR